MSTAMIVCLALGEVLLAVMLDRTRAEVRALAADLNEVATYLRGKQ